MFFARACEILAGSVPFSATLARVLKPLPIAVLAAALAAPAAWADSGGKVITLPSGDGIYAGKNEACSNAVFVNTLDSDYAYAAGGYSAEKKVTGNTLTIERDVVHAMHVFGGYFNGAGGQPASNNTLILQGHLTLGNNSWGNAYGGYSVSGAATGNTVRVENPTPSRNYLHGDNAVHVFGGYTEGLASNATGNTVILASANVFVSDLWGGLCDATDCDAVTGNTLHVQAKGLSVGGKDSRRQEVIQNFDTLKFTLPYDTKDGDTMLSAEYAYFPEVKLKVNISLAAGSPLQRGDTITLLKHDNSTKDFALASKTVEGGGRVFELNHSDSNSLTATVIDYTKPEIVVPSGSSIGTQQIGKYFLSKFEAASATPVTWSYVGTLPPGVSVNENGWIGGTPTKAGTYTFTVYAKNQNSSEKVPKTVTLVIKATPLITTPSGNSIGAKKRGEYFLGKFAASSATPVSWKLSDGELPTGVTVNPNGYIGGTPINAGTFNFTVRATNSVGFTEKNVKLVIKDTPLITTPSGDSIGTKKLGQKFLGKFAASSTTPVTWSATGLPPGVSVNVNGYIGGTPTKAGTYTFTVNAKNSVGTTSKPINIKIVN